MKLRKKIFNNPFFQERVVGGTKNNIHGSCLKRGSWAVHRFKVGGGGLAKKEGVKFWRSSDIPHLTLRY